MQRNLVVFLVVLLITSFAGGWLGWRYCRMS